MKRLGRYSLLFLSQFRDRAWMILLISLGAGLITRAIRTGIDWHDTGLEWGVGLLVFGIVTLWLRSSPRTQD